MKENVETRAVVILYNGKEPSGVAINQIAKALSNYERANSIEITSFEEKEIKSLVGNTLLKEVAISKGVNVAKSKINDKESEEVKALKEALTFLCAKYTFIQTDNVSAVDAIRLLRDLTIAKNTIKNGDNGATALITALEVIVKASKMHSEDIEKVFKLFGLSDRTIMVLCSIYGHVQENQ